MIRLNIPFTDESELKEIKNVLDTGYLTQGLKTSEFEKKVASLIGCRFSFGMSSCTTALHLSLVVLDIKPGDEVLVADFTFPATANVVAQIGAIPILVDINLDTFTMNPDDMVRKITDRTKAVIPVDAFGCAADFDSILSITESHNLPVIEDAATAIGAMYYDRYCGNLSTLGCFSFHPRKVITTGEGGMITTNDSSLAEKIKLLRNHGGVKIGDWYQFESAGYNYRLSDVLGAIGVAQMEKLSWIIDRKRQLAKRFSDRLKNVPGIRIPMEPRWGGHIFQSYVIMLDENINRIEFIQKMKTLGIETTLGTYALHDQPFFQRKYGYTTGQLPNSHSAFIRSVTLPLYPQMTNDDIDFIVGSIEESI